MSGQIQVLPGERKTLITLGTVIFFLGIFIFLVHMIYQNIGTALNSPTKPEIAVLVPLRSGEPGKEIAEIARRGINRAVSEGKNKGITISIHEYDAGESPNQAAWAAMLALRNPNTVAIVGPIDSRQTLAVAEVLHGSNIPIITIGSTAPVLFDRNLNLKNVYRIPNSDDQQGKAVVDFAVTNNWKKVYLVAEPTLYVQKVLNIFNQSSKNVLTVTGSSDTSKQSMPEAVQAIKDQRPKAVVYFGNPAKALELLQQMEQSDVRIPVIGLDPLGDPSFTSVYSGNVPVYFASPILHLAAVPQKQLSARFKETLGDKLGSPYAYETLQAVWLISEALEKDKSADLSPRQKVWNQVDNLAIVSWDGKNPKHLSKFMLSPKQIYFYKFDSASKQLSFSFTWEE